MLSMTILAALESSSYNAISIAIAGMIIVGVALSLISLFIAGLPRLLEVIARFWPEIDEPHAKKSHPESLVPDNDAVLAAIGYVLHCEFEKQVRSDASTRAKN